MKRFAAHYLYFPDYGFLKQYVVEMTDAGEINRIFPLINEMASVEWLPGVLVLSFNSAVNRNYFDKSDILNGLPENIFSEFIGKKILLFRAYPFDFVNMRITPDTKLNECREIRR